MSCLRLDIKARLPATVQQQRTALMRRGSFPPCSVRMYRHRSSGKTAEPKCLSRYLKTGGGVGAIEVSSANIIQSKKWANSLLSLRDALLGDNRTDHPVLQAQRGSVAASMHLFQKIGLAPCSCHSQARQTLRRCWRPKKVTSLYSPPRHSKYEKTFVVPGGYCLSCVT